jgi:serine O-acetyltransferase
MTAEARDLLWQKIRQEAEAEADKEPVLASFLHKTVLNHAELDDVLSFVLAYLLDGPVLDAMSLREMIRKTMSENEQICQQFRADVPLLYFKGFQAIQCYRIAHHIWNEGRHTLALFLQSRISSVFAVDIHPAARIGCGLLLDHATGVVIGETAVVEDNVSILHEVTLGGTGKQRGDRHPKIREGVLIGAGSKILGNVEVGRGAKIGSGSVVLSNVPAHCTVAGVPAKIVGRAGGNEPAQAMEHRLGKNGVHGHIPCEKNPDCEKDDCSTCSRN